MYIHNRIDFDSMLSPMSKRKDFNEDSGRHSGSGEDDIGESESVEDQERSYVTPERPAVVEESKKTPAKEQVTSFHETRYRNR